MTEQLKEKCGFDVLGDILETLRFRGSIFFRSELAPPWGMSLAFNGIPRFHIALSGSFFLGVDGGDGVEIQQGGIVMLPGGSNHWIADRPGRQLIPIDNAVEACELNNPFFRQGEISNHLMCGLINFDQGMVHPVFNSLPALLHFPEIDRNGPVWLTITSIEQAINQAQSLRSPIVDRLTEVLFFQLLNDYISKENSVSGFLAAFRDRRIHRALTLIHQHPNFNWSLASLGDQVGMSRATLVRHFQDTIGIAPMTYITNWRMTKAHSLIKHANTSLEQVAEQVGFASARTLSKAFLRHYGCTPSQLRRKQQD